MDVMSKKGKHLLKTLNNAGILNSKISIGHEILWQIQKNMNDANENENQHIDNIGKT